MRTAFVSRLRFFCTYSSTTGVNFTNLLAQSPAVIILRHWVSPKNYAKLYQCTQLEVIPNINILWSALYASKISINILAKKLHLNLRWNWLQIDKEMHDFFSHTPTCYANLNEFDTKPRKKLTILKTLYFFKVVLTKTNLLQKCR